MTGPILYGVCMTRFASALLIALAVNGPGAAPAGPGIPAEVDILPGWRAPDGTHMAALRITLDEGWKTYWRAPGEAGIPPSIDWGGSSNLGDVGFHWPVPEIIVSNGITTLGYAGELILPIEIMAADPGADISIEASLAFGICEEVCMPLQAEVSGVLPVAVAAEDPRIAGALAARPETAEEAAVASMECRVEPISDGLRVTLRIDMPPVGPDEYLVVEPQDRSVWVSEAIVERAGNILTAETDLVPPDAKPFELDTETLRITVLDRGRGVDIHGCAESR